MRKVILAGWLAISVMMSTMVAVQGAEAAAVSALRNAIDRCDIAQLQKLGPDGRTINRYDEEGNALAAIAITQAVLAKSPERQRACKHSLQFVLDNGADLTMPAKSNHVASMFKNGLLLSIMTQRYDTVGLLLHYMDDINWSADSETVLMMAVKYRDPILVRLLLDASADAMRRDKDGNTALDYARLAVNPKRLEILEVMRQPPGPKDEALVLRMVTEAMQAQGKPISEGKGLPWHR